MGEEAIPMGLGSRYLGPSDAGGSRAEGLLGRAAEGTQGAEPSALGRFLDHVTDFEISQVPTEADQQQAHLKGLQDAAFDRLKHQLLDRERERFKTDALVAHVLKDTPSGDVNFIVRAISRLMTQASYRFPKHAPIDAAYAWIRDGDV